MKKISFLFLFYIFSLNVFAQTDIPSTIKVIARAKKDTVILRWAPTTSLAWEIANQYGYIVKRYSVFKNGVLDTVNTPPEVVLTTTPLKPLKLEEWEPVTKNDNYAAIAAQALYGKSFVLSTSSTDAVQFYNQTEDKDSRHSFALFAADHSASTAQALGLRLVDTSIKKDEKYVYRVFVAGSHPQYAIAPGTIFVDPEERMKLPAPEDLQAEFGDQAVSLSWKSFYLQSIYVSYKIERSDDEGKTFKPPTDQVFLNTRNNKDIPQRTFYVDSLPSNYKVYFFRVRGLTPFGEPGPPSEAVKGVGLGSAKGAIAVIDVTHVYDNGGVYIQWRFPKDLLDKLTGFTVANAKSAKGPFVDITKEIIKASDNHYVDKNPYSVNYYVIKAKSKDGTITTSFPALVQLDDSTPPAIPKGLSGQIDKTGIVKLQWTQNDEMDFAGYRVFRANNLNEEFVQITKDILIQNTFTDTVNIQTLTRNVYYKVVALDYRYNPSDYSEALPIQRPDVIAPSATQFIKAEPNKDHISLEWVPGANDDIKLYQLFRAALPDTTFTLLKEINVADSLYHFSDESIVAGTRYTYKLVITDQSGLQSKAATITVAAIDYGIRPIISGIRHAIDRDKRHIKLEWDYNENGVSGFQIYKAKAGAPLRLYKFLTTKSFQDKNISANTKYVYAIKAIYESGAESALSKEVEIGY